MNIRDDKILNLIKAQGQKCYLVGGYLRDLYLNKNTFDRDIVTDNPEIFAKNLADKNNASFVVLDSENKIYRVVFEDKENYVDITEPVGGTIEKDLLRRDFTINAIAYDLETDNLIDLTGGLDDIKNRIIRYVEEKNFPDDPLRILRAFRFMATTGFEFSKETEVAINKYKHLLKNPAQERITYEIMKLFGGKCAAKTLLKMDEFGILEELFPCVNEMKKVTPNSHHHLDLFHHVVETVRNVENLYNDLPKEQKEHLDRIDFGGFPRINHLKLSAFLHDIGKFSTWTIQEDGRHRFIKHEEVGSKLCVPMLKNMKFSKKQIDYISTMIKYHIYPSNVIVAPELNDKIMMRYIRKMENNVIDNIILAKADRLSARGEAITEDIVKENLDGLTKLLNFYMTQKDNLKPLPKLLSGNDIMKIRNLKQGPELKPIVESLKEAQLNGDILTREDAINFVTNYM